MQKSWPIKSWQMPFIGEIFPSRSCVYNTDRGSHVPLSDLLSLSDLKDMGRLWRVVVTEAINLGHSTYGRQF